jgi:hypothetical protein
MFNYRILNNKTYLFSDYTVKPLSFYALMRIRRWRNDQINILRQKEKLSKLKQFLYYMEVVKFQMDKNPKNILFGYYFNKKLIGYGGFVHIDWINLSCELSFLLDTKYYETNEYELHFLNINSMVLGIAFLELGFNAIRTETYNVRPIHLKCINEIGFKEQSSSNDNIIFHEFSRSEYVKK